MLWHSLSQRRDFFFFEKANSLHHCFFESLSKIDGSPITNTMRSSFSGLRIFTGRGDFANIILGLLINLVIGSQIKRNTLLTLDTLTNFPEKKVSLIIFSVYKKLHVLCLWRCGQICQKVALSQWFGKCHLCRKFEGVSEPPEVLMTGGGQRLRPSLAIPATRVPPDCPWHCVLYIGICLRSHFQESVLSEKEFGNQSLGG